MLSKGKAREVKLHHPIEESQLGNVFPQKKRNEKNKLTAQYGDLKAILSIKLHKDFNIIQFQQAWKKFAPRLNARHWPSIRVCI